MTIPLTPGRYYVLLQDPDLVSVVQVGDASQYRVICTSRGRTETAAETVAALGWQIDGDWIAAPIGHFAPLRRSGPGQPPKHGPVKRVPLRLPRDVYDRVKAAADAAGHSVNDEIIARCSRP